MKKILIVIWGIMFIFGVGSASPLTDYSAGKVALDLNFRTGPDFSVGPDYLLQHGSGKKALTDGGITVGLAERFAFQYKGLGSKTEVRAIPHTWYPAHNVENQLKLAVDEFNLLYALDENFRVFVGYASGKGTHTLTEREAANPNNYSSSTVNSPKKNIMQIGFIGTAKLADKWTGYGIVGAGRGYTAWELGTGYRISPDIELNINYKSVKVNKLKMPRNEVSLGGFGYAEAEAERDITVKGLGMGLTFRF